MPGTRMSIWNGQHCIIYIPRAHYTGNLRSRMQRKSLRISNWLALSASLIKTSWRPQPLQHSQYSKFLVLSSPISGGDPPPSHASIDTILIQTILQNNALPGAHFFINWRIQISCDFSWDLMVIASHYSALCASAPSRPLHWPQIQPRGKAADPGANYQ